MLSDSHAFETGPPASNSNSSPCVTQKCACVGEIQGHKRGAIVSEMTCFGPFCPEISKITAKDSFEAAVTMTVHEPAICPSKRDFASQTPGNCQSPIKASLKSGEHQCLALRARNVLGMVGCEGFLS